MKSIVITFLCLTVISGCAGNFNETIRTGRPGQAIGAYTLGTGVFQLQSGFDFFKSSGSEQDFHESGFLYNTVLRFGVSELFELSGQFDYRLETIASNCITQVYRGVDAIDIRMRYHIFSGHDAISKCFYLTGISSRTKR